MPDFPSPPSIILPNQYEAKSPVIFSPGQDIVATRKAMFKALGVLPGVGGPLGAPETLTALYLGSAADTSAQSTFTYTTQPLGNQVARHLIIAIGCSGSGAVLSGVSAGGVAGTLLYDDSGAGNVLTPQFWAVPLSSAVGTTGTITATFTASTTHVRIGIWVVYGPWALSATNAQPTAATSVSITMTVPAEGFAIVAARNIGPNSIAFTNATSRFNSGNSVSSFNLQFAGGDFSNAAGASTSRTFTATSTAQSRIAGIVIA